MEDLVSEHVEGRTEKLARQLDNIVREIDAELVKLTAQKRAAIKARHALTGGGDPPKQRRKVETDSARIAGPAAIFDVGNTLALVGRTTQAEITKDTKLNSGTVTHALRALAAEDPPKVRKTGQRFRGSDEWTWLGDPIRTTVVDVGEGVHEGRRVS